MFNWLKNKVIEASVYQVKNDIALNVQVLVSQANKSYAHLLETGSPSQREADRIFETQKILLYAIQVGISNNLTLDETKNIIYEKMKSMEVSEGAKMAVDHVLEKADDEFGG